MATIFTSSSIDDIQIAQALEARLLEKGHHSKLPVGKPNVGYERANITRALAGSDVLIAILSREGLRAQNVIGEIGAARILAHTRTMLVLPVLIDSMEVPNLVSDLYCFQGADRNLDRLAREIVAAIADYVQRSPRIFISHKHQDRPIAAALVGLLEAAFDIRETDLRCTSVPPYSLALGERSSERLRSDIAGAEVMIGILSPASSQSRYVLCELGASWGLGIRTFPVLVRDARIEDVPPPINELHNISLETEESCRRLVESVAAVTSLRAENGDSAEIAVRARNLAQVAGTPVPQATSA